MERILNVVLVEKELVEGHWLNELTGGEGTGVKGLVERGLVKGGVVVGGMVEGVLVEVDIGGRGSVRWVLVV